MQLILHLKDEELTDLLLAADQRELQQTLAAVPNQLRLSTERPEWFWKKQQAAIRERVRARRRSAWRLLPACAGVLGLALLATTLLHHGRTPAPPAAPQAQAVSDQELMIAVEQAVQTDVPDALAPAALLADEISNSQSSSTSNRFPKENKHEN
jgi:hypothetical protein